MPTLPHDLAVNVPFSMALGIGLWTSNLGGEIRRTELVDPAHPTRKTDGDATPTLERQPKAAMLGRDAMEGGLVDALGHGWLVGEIVPK
jgi:hypothetical protein